MKSHDEIRGGGGGGGYNVTVYFLTERSMHEPCGFRIFL